MGQGRIIRRNCVKCGRLLFSDVEGPAVCGICSDADDERFLTEIYPKWKRMYGEEE